MPGQESMSIHGLASRRVVHFGEATPDQRLQCHKLGASAFGTPLSEDEFIEREEYMSQQPLTRGTGWRFWCVYAADEPNLVFATCKTIHRDVLIKDAHSIREAQGYCIASVVTHASFKRQGLATYLLGNVAQWLDGLGNAAVSMLYSSKADFYAPRGWHPVADLETIISPVGASAVTSSQWPSLPKVDMLEAEDIESLCERDMRALRIELEAQSVEGQSSLVMILPTADLVSWLHARAEFVGLKINGISPVSKGAVCETVTWAYWHHDFRKQCLYIQRIRSFVCDREAKTKALTAVLLHACREADVWKLPRIIIWNVDSDTRRAIELLTTRYGIQTIGDERPRRETLSIRCKNADNGANLIMYPDEFYAWN